MSAAATQPVCPCGSVTTPWVVFNPPAREVIAYRWGDYTSFRYALLQALPGETALTQTVGGQVQQVWRPTAEGDLALQMVEWWAYLSDILTFYNERIATQAYLRTADLPESTNRLIQLLGYRPRPGLGASGYVAALLGGSKPVTLPQGFQIQSKPGPGEQPQIFELGAQTVVGLPDAVPAEPTPSSLPLLSSDATTVWLAGKISGIKPNDKLLLVKQSEIGTGTIGDFAWMTVKSAQPQTDPNGNPVTAIVFTAAVSLSDGNPQAADYLLYRAAQSAVPWSFGGDSTVMSQTDVYLASIARSIGVGDPVLVDASALSSPFATTLVTIQSYAETVWYATSPNPPPVTSPPTSPPIVSIAISHLTFNQSLASADWNGNVSAIALRFGWTAVGQLTAVLTPEDNVFDGTVTSLTATTATQFPAGSSTTVLIADVNGDGTQAQVTAGGSAASTLAIDSTTMLPTDSFTAPLEVLYDLLPVSRGKTVANEVLGSGNAAVLGQDFTLQKSPVTYLQDAASLSGDDFSSTVQVWVNGIQWQEVRSFYGQAANAQVFLTREDEQGSTHVVFNGRLPTGVNNVVATYRYGSGLDAPDPGTLTVVLQPQPGLKGIANPVAPTGGADPDPPSKIKQLAPRSVMTFNRAVSLDDYQVIAASAPGVTRASAAFVFDPLSQRDCVNVWVGDDADALTAAQNAIAAAADPNKPVKVQLATAVTMSLGFTYLRDSRYPDATVQAGLQTALVDPDQGLFGTNAVAIGQVFYDSQIYAACLAVPGVVAIHNLSFTPALDVIFLNTIAGSLLRDVALTRLAASVAQPAPVLSGRTFRTLLPFAPMPATLLKLRPACTGERYDPGPGSFYVVPSVNLNGTVAP